MKETGHHSKNFLALTALEDFWDTSRPLLFLGEWCQRYERKRYWKNLNASVLSSPKLNYANSYEAYQHAMTVYEKLLPRLANWLNELHGTHHSLKYWKLLVGPFLFWYTQIVYHRFLYLQAAFYEYPDLETYGLSHHSFLTPANTNEFVYWSYQSDNLNLQIFTQLLALAFKCSVNYKAATWETELNQRKMNFCDVSYRTRTRFLLYCLRIMNKLRKFQVVGLLDGFCTKDVFKLIIKSRFRILPILPTHPINRSQTLGRSVLFVNRIDMQARKQLINHIDADDLLSKLVVHTLPVNMPFNFIEGYQEEVICSKKYFPYVSKVIMVESCDSYDQYKFWIGEQIEKGAKLVGYQHGGCYGMQKASSAEFLECHVSDYFISWGWSSCEKVLPASMLHIHKYFSSYFRKEKNEKLHEILWVATLYVRYPMAIFDWPITSKPYINYQKRFFNALETKLASEICMRLSPSFNNYEEIKEYLPDLNVHFPMDCNSFFTHLSRSKIAVIDNPSTPFLYALAFNIPTVLFWDKEHWVFRNEAKSYLDLLGQVGIYHDSPESAATMLNKIADDPYPWWNSEPVQSARQKLCDSFARIS